jgi:heme exporter protein C
MSAEVFRSVLGRDLRLAARRRVDALLPLAFFAVAVSLFPLGVGPEPGTLRQIAPGVLWVCALLAAMLSVNALYAGDAADGSLEQMLLAGGTALPVPLALAKACSHWLLTGLPLVLVAPLFGLMFGLGALGIATLCASLLLGTPILSLLGGLGAALTLGVRNGGVLLILLILPLCIPALIFGSGAATSRCWARSSSRPRCSRRWRPPRRCASRPTSKNARTRMSNAIPSFRLFHFAAPARFYALAGRLVPWCWIVAALFAAAGLYIGFFEAPTDATQGDAYRIVFIHVPAAWMSMVLYVAMAFWAALGWAFNARLAAMVARAIAPTGALFTFLALWTGALWGKPTWGAWWVWDARLTSELILLFLYLGYMALVNAIDDTRRADQAGALLAVIGSVNVPIIYFSVKWWNTLHQGASIGIGSAPTMAASMLLAMLLMTIAFWAYAFAVVFMRTRAIVVEREADAQWLNRAMA